VEFRPAPAWTGITFVRGDLSPAVRVPARVVNRVEVPRRTVLQQAAVRVEMVEHALAALHGLQIDNCEIWLDRRELPGLDGSSAEYVAALAWAGIETQNAACPALQIDQVTRLGDEQSWIEARPATRPGLSLRYLLDYGENSPIGRQVLQVALTPRVFRDQLSAARTFLLEAEAAALKAQGLGRAATLHDLLIFGKDGPVENRLRFSDECVRHKLLDLVGDLALAGCDLQGHVTAFRSGHRLNAELVGALLAQNQVRQVLRRGA
jgi:UDP-3-O-acyl N-acetylglucosamine deacetylase